MPPVKKVKPAKAVKPAVVAAVVEPVISGQLKKKIKKQTTPKVVDKRGVIFIKHLPHGFFEEQLKKYFEQFGSVTRLRLVRSKRTGGSKGFAFVEFEYPEVAQVAAETMDNYLMFKRVIKASYISPENQRFNYFKSSLRKIKNKAGKEIYVSGKSASITRMVKKQNDWSSDAYQKRTKAKLRKINKLSKKYAHLGIDFSSLVVAPTKVSAADKIALNSTTVEEDSQTTSKNKRKNQTQDSKTAQTQKKTKKTVELEDLLGNTIGEDSDDDDWRDSGEKGNDDDEVTSDEETYGFSKDSDTDEEDDDDDEVDDEDDVDDESDEEVPMAIQSKSKKSKPSFEKSTKPSKVDRFDQLIKRKPHLGGIQKPNKPNKAVVSKAKKSMQIKAVKELANTKLDMKSNKKIKAKGARKQNV